MKLDMLNESEYKKQNLKIGAVMLFFLGASLVVSIALEAISLVSDVLPAVTYEVFYELFYSVLYFCMFFIPMMLYGTLDKNYSYSQVPCKFKLSKYLPLLLFAGLAINYVASYINSIIVTLLGLDMSSLTFGEYPNGYHAYNFVLDTIEMAIIPAFCEELLFRGLILDRLKRFGRSRAIIISALMFSLMHQHPAQLFYTFILGMFLGYMALESGSIWGGIILHFVNNFSQVIMTAIEQTMPEEKATFIIYAIELCILLIGLVCALIYFIKHSKDTLGNDEWMFGEEVCISDRYAIKGFFTPTTIIFISVSAISAIAYFLY